MKNSLRRSTRGRFIGEAKLRVFLSKISYAIGNLRRPELYFTFITAVFGLIFVFLIPPFQNIDEPSHFYRAFQLSRGDIYGMRQDGKTGDYLPKGLVDSFQDYGYLIFNYGQKTHPGKIIHDITTNESPDEEVFVEFNNTVIYPPVTYLPQAIGIRLATLVSDEPLIALYAARLASLATWMVAMWVVIRMLPVGKWSMVVLGLFPMILVQAASASSDATVNTISVLAIGLMATLVLRNAKDRVKDRLRLAALALVSVGLALVKMPAVALLVLALAIPSDRFGGFRRKVLYLGGLVIVASVLFLAWNLSVASMRVELRPDTSTALQLDFILSHPIEYVKILAHYPFQVRADQTLIQMYGWLGWNEVKLPFWMMLFGFVTLLLTLFNPEFKKFRITGLSRAIGAIVAGLMVLVIITLLYLSWMPVGHPQLYDVWGRYFVSLLPLSILVIGGVIVVDRKSWRNAKRFIAVATPIVLTIVLLLVVNRYYGAYAFGDFIVPGTSSW